MPELLNLSSLVETYDKGKFHCNSQNFTLINIEWTCTLEEGNFIKYI